METPLKSNLEPPKLLTAAARKQDGETIKHYLGSLHIDSPTRERALVNAVGIAEQLRKHFGDRVLLTRSPHDDDNVVQGAYFAHRGGTWLSADDCFDAAVQTIASETVMVMQEARSEESTDTDAGRARRSDWRTHTTAWRKACKTYGKDRHEIAKGFGVELGAGMIDGIRDDIHIVHPRALTDSLHKLGAVNGVVDLLTGRHIADAEKAKREYVIGHLPDPYNPAARDEPNELTDGLFAHLDKDVYLYLLESIAYALRGNPNRTFLLLLGAAGGGKSTLMNALAAALGDYAGTVHEDAFSRRRSGGTGLSPNIRALVAPRRLAFLPEANKAVYQTERLKSVAGADMVNWRGLNKEERSERVTATLLMAANELPMLDGSDAALMERMVVLPYPTLPRANRRGDFLTAFSSNTPLAIHARQKLVASLVAAGMCLDDKPEPPKSVVAYTKEARDNLLGDAGAWLAENIVAGSATDRLSSRRVWEALCDAFSKPHDSKIVADLSRRQCTKLISGTHAQRTKKLRDSVSGEVGRGWVGLKILD